jgi:hypothetical protein
VAYDPNNGTKPSHDRNCAANVRGDFAADGGLSRQPTSASVKRATSGVQGQFASQTPHRLDEAALTELPTSTFAPSENQRHAEGATYGMVGEGTDGQMSGLMPGSERNLLVL